MLLSNLLPVAASSGHAPLRYPRSSTVPDAVTVVNNVG